MSKVKKTIDNKSLDYQEGYAHGYLEGRYEALKAKEYSHPISELISKKVGNIKEEHSESLERLFKINTSLIQNIRQSLDDLREEISDEQYVDNNLNPHPHWQPLPEQLINPEDYTPLSDPNHYDKVRENIKQATKKAIEEIKAKNNEEA
jgi:hypothetical protein